MEQVLQRVHTRIIIEVLGSPKEHAIETLQGYVARLREDKTVTIHKADYAEPQERDGLYAVFVELDMTFKDADHLLSFCFDAMPSSIEILAPTELNMQSKDFEGFLNDLQARLHTVDLALKQARAMTKVLDTNAMNVLHNFIVFALQQGPKSAEQLSKIVGIPADKIGHYLEQPIAAKKIKKEGTTYTI
ncbi:hypothetical protein HY492_01550 [Candidatus Woesearchaeota archaeon]|nr:hypothetical protein [Candidatus Woesearchaeota archaeon]